MEPIILEGLYFIEQRHIDLEILLGPHKLGALFDWRLDALGHLIKSRQAHRLQQYRVIGDPNTRQGAGGDLTFFSRARKIGLTALEKASDGIGQDAKG